MFIPKLTVDIFKESDRGSHGLSFQSSTNDRSLRYSPPPVVLRQAEANKRLARTGFEQLGLPEANGAGLNASQICVRRVPAKRCDDVDFPAGFTLPHLSKGYRSRLCLHGILHVSAATVAGMSDRDLSRLPDRQRRAAIGVCNPHSHLSSSVSLREPIMTDTVPQCADLAGSIPIGSFGENINQSGLPKDQDLPFWFKHNPIM